LKFLKKGKPTRNKSLSHLKLQLLAKAKKFALEWKIGLQLNKTKDAKVYIASFSMFNNTTSQPTNAKVDKFDGT
jgi:hypothetical protein